MGEEKVVATKPRKNTLRGHIFSVSSFALLALARRVVLLRPNSKTPRTPLSLLSTVSCSFSERPRHRDDPIPVKKGPDFAAQAPRGRGR